MRVCVCALLGETQEQELRRPCYKGLLLTTAARIQRALADPNTSKHAKAAGAYCENWLHISGGGGGGRDGH